MRGDRTFVAAQRRVAFFQYAGGMGTYTLSRLTPWREIQPQWRRAAATPSERETEGGRKRKEERRRGRMW